MRKLFMFSALLLIAVAFTGCRSWWQPDVDEIIANVKKKSDPQNKAETVNSAIFKYDYVNDQEKGKITILLKRPGKIKIMSRIGKDFWECAFDGKKAWEYASDKGVRFLKEKETNEVRLQAFLLAPSINIRQIFKKIQVECSEKVDGEDCWKLICQPSDDFKSQPIKVYVDKKTYLIVKAIEEQDTESEVIEVVTTFKDYRRFRGFMLPVITITKVDDDLTESRLVRVELNREIPDSAFTAPEAYK
ncbi:MAG: outer membrane lipoprotein-sorting protein [Victivallaceae bacterium]|nr:outer membrane lipoprotein-sorting protein [Victivallaceae bacterium]